MNRVFSFTRIGIFFAFLAAAGGPALAQPGQYEKPALMHAILAKVWGTVCPDALTTSEISEVQTFIDRWISTRPDPEAFSNPDGDGVAQKLEKVYFETYRAPGKCLEWNTREQAQAYLQRIRRANSDPAYWADLRERAFRG